MTNVNTNENDNDSDNIKAKVNANDITNGGGVNYNNIGIIGIIALPPTAIT